VFFVTIVQLYSHNNLYYQLSNNKYIIALNQNYFDLFNSYNNWVCQLPKNDSIIDFQFNYDIWIDFDPFIIDPNVYIFVSNKYNFFKSIKFIHSFFDIVLISAFTNKFFLDLNDYSLFDDSDPSDAFIAFSSIIYDQ